MYERIFKTGRAIALGMLAIVSVTSYAADGLSLAVASGTSTRMARMGAQWQWKREWHASHDIDVSGYWDLTLAQWREGSYRNTGEARNITDIGLTPVFRLHRTDSSAWYGEVAVGAHFFSNLYDNASRQLSTRFEFGDHLGAGYVASSGMDIGILFQHFSNAGMKRPNGGVNFAVLRICYPLR